jgi:hypothetical protein
MGLRLGGKTVGGFVGIPPDPTKGPAMVRYKNNGRKLNTGLNMPRHRRQITI